MASQQYDEDEDTAATAPADAADEASDASADTVSSGDEDSDEAEEAGAAAPAAVPAWKDYLTKKYQLDQGIQQARQDALDTQRTTGIFQGLSSMFGQNHDNFYNSQRAQANQRLAQAMQDRQMGLQDFETQRQVGRQDVADALRAKQAAFQESQNQRTREQQAALDAPDSAESEFARNMAQRFDPKGADAGNFDDLSATQIMRLRPEIKDLYDQTMKQDDMRLRWAQLNDQRQWQKDYKQMELNRPFIQSFNTAENKYQDAVGKIDQTQKMVDQATGTGGVAATLVPLEVARGIAGRLNPQEIAAAGGDPSTLGKINRMISTAAEGQMDGVDAEQFRTLLQSQRDSLTSAREAQRNQNIGAWARNTNQDPKQLRMTLLGDTGAAAPAKGTPSPQDQQALDWLNANPTDPAAAGVKATLQKKGLL
jgi:hypothetical protein